MRTKNRQHIQKNTTESLNSENQKQKKAKRHSKKTKTHNKFNNIKK